MIESAEEIAVSEYLCPACKVVANPARQFCNSCGASLHYHDETPADAKWTWLKQLALFYAIDLGCCLVAKYVPAFDSLFWSIVFDVLMAITAIAFFAINWDENKKLLSWPNFSTVKLLSYCGIAVIGSIIVQYSVRWLNLTIYSNDDNYYSFFRGNFGIELFLVFFVAVMPALFEELAYRGYMMAGLQKIADRQQTIYIAAFLFAVIHMTLISLFWLIPFAIFLGYIRDKERTLWYGVCVHFLFNFIAVIFGLYW